MINDNAWFWIVLILYQAICSFLVLDDLTSRKRRST